MRKPHNGKQEPTRKQLNIRVGKAVRMRLNSYHIKTRVPISDIVELALEKYLKVPKPGPVMEEEDIS